MFKKCLNVRQKLGTRNVTKNFLKTWKTFVFLSMLKSHSLTLSISHSLTLNMLNNFCFHVYAQKSLFKFENVNAFFLTAMLFSWEPALWTHESQDRVMWLSKKKPLQFLPKIVTFEHRHENKSCSACRERVNERVWEWECESARVCRDWSRISRQGFFLKNITILKNITADPYACENQKVYD